MNKTIIFSSYSEFLTRENKDLNGVSALFAKENPDYQKENETNTGCWNCYDCSRCSRCYDCYDCSGCYGCSSCYDCSGCYGCSSCYDCYDCYDCSGCSSCSGLKNASQIKNDGNNNAGFRVPVIDNIHQKVYEAASKDGALNMNDWHSCETTHCRAGWVTFLAGEEGKELEKKTSTLFAAMQIYHKSSPSIKVSPTRFFESSAFALEDMRRCAEEEKKLNQSHA